jgi:hypothetical protein
LRVLQARATPSAVRFAARRDNYCAGIHFFEAGSKICLGAFCMSAFVVSESCPLTQLALAVPGRPGLHKIAKQFGVGSGTVQRIAAARWVA